MRKGAWIAAVAALAAAALVVWGVAVRPGRTVPVPGRDGAAGRAKALSHGNSPAAGGDIGWSRGAPDAPAPEPVPPASSAAGSAVASSAAGAGTRLELAALPPEDEPLARVNGVALTAGKVFPPGVMLPGDRLPKSTYDKFLEEAVNRALVVQEAERRGYADAPEMAKLLDDLRRDVAELPNLSPEEKEWQVNELREMALAERLYREEGIVPRRLTAAEIESHYAQHAAEYEWVRRREAPKGASPEKIERRVKEEIRRELQGPIGQELRRQRQELAESLRRNAQIETP